MTNCHIIEYFLKLFTTMTDILGETMQPFSDFSFPLS
jgi:hypothetical protein